MKKKFIASILGAAFFTFTVTPAMAQTLNSQNSGVANSHTAPSAADFAYSGAKSFAVSPNGQMLAFLSGEGKGAKLVIMDLNTVATREVLIGDKVKPRRVQWAGNNYILTTISVFYDAESYARDSNYRYEMWRTSSYSIATGKSFVLLPNSEAASMTAIGIEHVSQENPTDIIMSSMAVGAGMRRSGDTRTGLALFKISLETGRSKTIAVGSSNTEYYAVDNNGQARLRVDSDKATRIVTLLKNDGSTWSKLLEFRDTLSMPFSINGFIDSDTVLIIDDKEKTRRPKKLNINTGEMTPIFDNETLPIAGVIMDPFNNQPIGLVYNSFNRDTKWLSPEMQKYQELLNRAFANKIVNILDWDKEKSKLVIEVSAGDKPTEHYIFNTKSLSAEGLSEFPESYSNYRFGSKTLEKMTASDGLEIPVLVTRPQNSTNKKMPTIILPHGGPESSDSFEYDYISQFLASRGYLIIQPQFRGSTGFGFDFAKKGYGEWAGKMQSDVNETVKWAADKGWIDKDRVCIVGASYGGYSALAGAAYTPDLYKCAISYGGVFALDEMQESTQERAGFQSEQMEYWIEHMGVARGNTAKIRAISPQYQAQNIKIPILLMHGTDDTIVPIKQSREMATALRRAGKNVQFIELEGEDHWLSRQATREKFLVEMEKFLAPILKPEQ